MLQEIGDSSFPFLRIYQATVRKLKLYCSIGGIFYHMLCHCKQRKHRRVSHKKGFDKRVGTKGDLFFIS